MRFNDLLPIAWEGAWERANHRSLELPAENEGVRALLRMEHLRDYPPAPILGRTIGDRPGPTQGAGRDAAN